MERICIGRIINTHGLKGEVRIESYSDFDSERYQKGSTVYIEQNGNMIPAITSSFRIHKGYPLVTFQGMEDINLVEPYKNCLVYVEKNSRPPLAEGEYYQSDLKGLEAYDESGNIIGIVQEVEPTNGAQNNLRIVSDNSSFLVPFIPEFIVRVDLSEKKIIIHMEEGLL